MTPPSADGVVVVTGGSRGIGAATATLLAEQGRKVIIVDILPEPLHEAAVILWREAFDVSNEAAVASGIAAIEAAHGPISGLVNVASVAGMTSGPIHAYTAAKAGVIQITQTLAAEWGRTGVRVNAVSPGFTRTAALEAGIASGALDKERLARNTAMNRLVEPIEVAHAIAWLLSPASSGVTGINLPVDAGFIAGSTWDAYGGLREAPRSQPEGTRS